jgi:putative transposase
MISLTYAEFVAIDETLARRMLLEVYQDCGANVSRTARELCCSRNTVRKWVRRHRDNLGLQGRSRRPRNCPRQTPPDLERLVVKERKKTNFGRVRLAHRLHRRHGVTLSPHTVRNILRRHRLSQPQKKRGKFRAITTHDWQSLYPLQHFQIDLKHILDLKSLPIEVYKHLRSHKLPPYQWTAIDPVTRTKFLAYSFQKSFTNGLALLLLVHLWLRAFGFFHTLYFQTDWGEEFGGKSLRKLQRLQKLVFDPANVQLKRIRKGCWKDNAYVERTHRTDDEEFHAPTSTRILDLDDHFRFALQWTYTFNCRRPHFGRQMNGQTPFQRTKSSFPWITERFYLFPPLILDRISAIHPFTGGQDVLATYFSNRCPPLEPGPGTRRGGETKRGWLSANPAIGHREQHHRA